MEHGVPHPSPQPDSRSITPELPALAAAAALSADRGGGAFTLTRKHSQKGGLLMIRRYQITVNDQAYDVTVEAGTPADRPADPALIPRCSTGKRPASTGTGMSAHVLLPRPAGAAGEIIAPVAGEILEVLAAPGQKVLAGDVLFILDAMKLENELTAPRDGAVAEVRVSPGDRVEAGAPLCQIR